MIVEMSFESQRRGRKSLSRVFQQAWIEPNQSRATAMTGKTYPCQGDFLSSSKTINISSSSDFLCSWPELDPDRLSVELVGELDESRLCLCLCSCPPRLWWWWFKSESLSLKKLVSELKAIRNKAEKTYRHDSFWELVDCAVKEWMRKSIDRSIKTQTVFSFFFNSC